MKMTSFESSACTT